MTVLVVEECPVIQEAVCAALADAGLDALGVTRAADTATLTAALVLVQPEQLAALPRHHARVRLLRRQDGLDALVRGACAALGVPAPSLLPGPSPAILARFATHARARVRRAIDGWLGRSWEDTAALSRELGALAAEARLLGLCELATLAHAADAHAARWVALGRTGGRLASARCLHALARAVRELG